MSKTELKRLQEEYRMRSQLIRSATAKSIFAETPEEQAKRIKRLLDPKNYNEFFQYYFGGDDKMSLSDAPCAKFQIEAYKKLVHEQYINQLRIWFRGSAKSTHTNVGNLFALKQINETKFSVIIGANELRANLLLADLQIHLESNEKIIKDFNQQLSYGDWSKGMFETTDGSYFMALGIDQPFRGLRRFANRVDFASVDDVEDRQVANNPRRVRERVEKITGDLGGAFGKNRRRLVVCNNLITNSGIVAGLISKIGDKPITHISKVNILDKHGKPTWSERYTQGEVDKLRKNTDHFTWSREMMNTPIEEGKIFKAEWIQYEAIPALNLFDGLIVYGDLSYKDTGDYKAMVLLGKIGRKYILIDCFVKQTSRTECARWLYDTYIARKLDNAAISYYFEGLFAQDEFRNDFDSEGDIRGFHIPILPDKKNKIDKHDRIESMVGHFERGDVFINEKLKENQNLKTLLDQLLAFEKGSTAADDAPDALQSAIAKLNQATYQENYDIPTTSIADFKKHSIHRF